MTATQRMVSEHQECNQDHKVLPKCLPQNISSEQFLRTVFRVQPLRVTHSIPDCCGLILRSEHGSIVHTGDWKIEEDPVDGQQFDRTIFEEIGAQHPCLSSCLSSLPVAITVSYCWVPVFCFSCNLRVLTMFAAKLLVFILSGRWEEVASDLLFLAALTLLGLYT